MKKHVIHLLLAFGLLSLSGCSTLSGLFGISIGVLFLIWIVPSLIPAMIASNKGRSGLGLFLLSIFFTPIVGLIVALIIAPISKVEVLEQAKHSVDETAMLPPVADSTTFMKDEPIDRLSIYVAIGIIIFIILVIYYSAR